MALTLIKGTKKKQKEKSWYMERYSSNGLRQLVCFTETGDRYALCSACLCLVRHFNLTEKQEDAETEMKLFNKISQIVSYMTPEEFLRTFPPKKTYDGAKYECIDYFSTMEKFQSIKMDSPLFESSKDILEFIYGYDNRDILTFAVRSMMLISRLHQQRTGREILDDFMISQGKEPLTKYHLYTNPNGKQFMVDEKGHSTPIKKRFPRYLRAVKK